MTAILPKWLNDQNRLRLVARPKLIYPTRTGDLRERVSEPGGRGKFFFTFFHFFRFFLLKFAEKI